jgi:hypothetical protein
MSPSETLTSEFNITVNLRLNAFPATVTSDAKALALNTDIGIAVNVGIKTGNTVEARTYYEEFIRELIVNYLNLHS